MITVTDEYKQIDRYLTDRKNSGLVFLTGKAGAGKSTFLKWFLKKNKINSVILAPTGIAALNIGGQTIHSFFKFKHYMQLDFKPKINHKIISTLNKCNLIIIDEISMVRADILDNIDKSMQLLLGNKKPFGGKMILAIGDLYQLPPVLVDKDKCDFEGVYNNTYFFSSNAFKNCSFKMFELTKVFRQKDDKFIRLLNQIREGELSYNKIDSINKKIRIQNIPENFKGTVLCSMNKSADCINQKKLREIDSKEVKYYAVVDGNFKDIPAPEELKLKIGAKVLFCKNTSFFKNGETGVITDLEEDFIMVKKKGGFKVPVDKCVWESFEYINGEAIVNGTYTQYPLKLGWAITIHKSQGMTFEDEIIIDTGNGCFASGQFYVAISRITNPKNVKLLKPLNYSDIQCDMSVKRFMYENLTKH